MSVSDSGHSISSHSRYQSGTYVCGGEAPILNIQEKTQQAQQVLQQQLEAFEINQDISESSLPFLQAYNVCLTVTHYSEQKTSAPTNAYKAFIAFKATFHPRYQDLLTFDFDPQRKHLTFKIAGANICQLGTSYDEITDKACNCLVYEIASEKFQKAVQSFEDEDRPIGLMAICQPMMEVFQQLLENGSSDAGFDEYMPAVGAAYERMKFQLPQACRDRVQLSVDLNNNSLTFSMSGKDIFKCARPSFSVDIIPKVCELAAQVVSLSFDCGNQEPIKQAARECFMTSNYEASQKIPLLQALIAALPQTPSPNRAIVIDVPPVSPDDTVDKATVTIAAVELHFPCLVGQGLPKLTELVEADQQRLMPENDALYESSMQNLRMISGWCEDQVRALAKRKSELTLEELNALYGDKGEIEQYRQKLLTLQTLIDADDIRDERVSDGAMKEQLLARLEILDKHVEPKRNEVITLKQLRESCESEADYKVLEPHAQLMLNQTTKPETLTSSATPHQGAWSLGAKPSFAEQQLTAFVELKQKAPAVFANRLCFHIQKTASYGKINVSIAIRSGNRNNTIAKVDTPLHDCLSLLGKNLHMSRQLSGEDLPELEDDQNRLPAQQLIEYINWQLTHPPMNKFEVIKSVLNLKWLCQKDGSYASSNPFQLVDYQIGQAKDTHLFIVVDGQIRASLQYTNADQELNEMIQWLVQEDETEAAFNQASPGESRILVYQGFARRQAQQKTFELQQLKERLAEQERIQMQREAELAEMRAQELEQQAKLQDRKLELSACRQALIAQLNPDVSRDDAEFLFDAINATNISVLSNANAVLRLFELSNDMSKYKVIVKANKSLEVWFDGYRLTTIDRTKRKPDSQDWNGAEAAFARIKKLKAQEFPQIGNALSMIPFTKERINLELKKQSQQRFELEPACQLPTYNSNEVFNHESIKAKLNAELTTVQLSPVTSRLQDYAEEIGDSKIDPFDEIQGTRFNGLLEDCGGVEKILGNTEAARYAETVIISIHGDQTVSLLQLVQMKQGDT